MMLTVDIAKEKLMIIHAKRTKGTVWCGQSIFGKVTNAEGYEVTCLNCLAEKAKWDKMPKYGWQNGKYVQLTNLE